MGKMTVLITAMKSTAQHTCLEHALPISLPAPTTAASHTPGAVTLIMTVSTVRMKLIAVRAVKEANSLTRIGFA